MVDEATNPLQIRSCPVFAETILAAAPKCKHCQEWLDGEPPANVVVSNVVTTEKTGKGWKSMILIGLFLVFVGFMSSHATGAGVGGAMFLFPGLVMIVVGGIGAWWRHGWWRHG